MKRECICLAIAAALFLGCLGLLINRLWVGYGWDVIFRGDMVWASELSAAFVRHWHENKAWPDANHIPTRLEFMDSERRDNGRIDRYHCGLGAEYTFEVHLRDDGRIEFYCWEKP